MCFFSSSAVELLSKDLQVVILALSIYTGICRLNSQLNEKMLDREINREWTFNRDSISVSTQAGSVVARTFRSVLSVSVDLQIFFVPKEKSASSRQNFIALFVQ